MPEALIGLAGIIVGAALTGLIDLLKRAREESALLAGVVRILELDLIELVAQLQWSLNDGRVQMSATNVERITHGWLEYRELLARRLAPDVWSQVARVFQTALVWVSRDGDLLQPLDREHLALWLSRVESAQDLLAAVGSRRFGRQRALQPTGTPSGR